MRKTHAVAALMAALALIPGGPAVSHGGAGTAVLGSAIGAAAGAVVGDSLGGRDGAILGSAVGGALGAAAGTARPRYYREGYVVVPPRPVYVVPATPVYVYGGPPGWAKHAHKHGWKRGHYDD